MVYAPGKKMVYFAWHRVYEYIFSNMLLRTMIYLRIKN